MPSTPHAHVVRQFLTVSAGFLLGASAQVVAQHALPARDGDASLTIAAGAAAASPAGRRHGARLAVTHCETDTIVAG